MIPSMSSPAFIALVALFTSSLAQARTLKLSYEGNAKNIVHNLGKESNVVELSIGQDGKLPDDGANWYFDLKPDGKRGLVKVSHSSSLLMNDRADVMPCSAMSRENGVRPRTMS